MLTPTPIYTQNSTHTLIPLQRLLTGALSLSLVSRLAQSMPITKHARTHNLLRDERRLAANRLAHDPRSLQDRRKELEPHVPQVVPGQASSAPGVSDPLPLLLVLGNAAVSLVRVVLGAEIDETPK